jgi:putative ubiquitin-RnfH superfamily antitoxin RatB of RatAB toxin-antitoxin module
MLRCEVVYARPEKQIVIDVELPAGATAGDALRASRLLETCVEIDPDAVVLGVFGKQVAADHLLRDGDRVEIYRPLKADPRIARRARVKSQSRRR